MRERVNREQAEKIVNTYVRVIASKKNDRSRELRVTFVSPYVRDRRDKYVTTPQSYGLDNCQFKPHMHAGNRAT